MSTEKSNPLIRPAQPRDIPRLVQMQHDFWELEHIDSFDLSHNQHLFERFLEAKHLGSILVVEASDATLCGYTIACRIYSFEFGGVVAMIDELYLEASLRGQGIGRLLLETISTQLREEGCVALMLEVDPHNAPAYSLYHKLGFTARGKYQTLIKRLQ